MELMAMIAAESVIDSSRMGGGAREPRWYVEKRRARSIGATTRSVCSWGVECRHSAKACSPGNRGVRPDTRLTAGDRSL